MQKFENMDVIAALEAIMHQNTAYYQSDFAYDIKMLREATRSNQPEDKLLLWLSRPSGTFCFRERDVLLKDTQAYNTWKFCGEQTHDRILAYAVELTGAANETVQGNLYELDYQQHFQHIRDAALPVGANRLIYESGMREIGPKEHFDSRPDKYFGEFVRYEMQPRDPELLQAAIRQEQRSREPARPGDFKEHLAALHTGLIEAEAQRIAADMKRLAAPNSPDKNHFMVEVSPYFTKLASSRDTDQLLAMLPYKSLRLSSVKDRFGIYALIDKNENRDKCMEQPIIILCANVAVKGADTPIFIGSFIHIPNTGIFIGNTKQSPKMRPIKILNTRVQNLGIRKAMVKFTVIVKIPAGIAVAEFLCEFCRKNWN